jgi:hypothetical protein
MFRGRRCGKFVRMREGILAAIQGAFGLANERQREVPQSYCRSIRDSISAYWRFTYSSITKSGTNRHTMNNSQWPVETSQK